MTDNIYIEFLVEDQSGSILIAEIMEKYKALHPLYPINYRMNSFKGIGSIPKKLYSGNSKKTGKLLNDLPRYLIGISKSLKHIDGKKAIFLVLDTDNNDCAVMKQQLINMKDALFVELDVYICLAIEEMEAWLLGDENAIAQTFPHYKRHHLNAYCPDSIIGTWEFLADTVYPGGLNRFNKDLTSYHEKGLQKCKWAKGIGQNLNVLCNRSPSFNHFISKLNLICN